MTERRRCAHCQRLFRPFPHVKKQRYCSRKECQGARKACWQREKMARDEDYRKTHRVAHRAWADENRDYWRRYRASHPEYEARNRELQRERDARRRAQGLAKMDASEGESPIESVSYILVPASLAKKDVSGQTVVVITEGFEEIPCFLQRRTPQTASARSP